MSGTKLPSCKRAQQRWVVMVVISFKLCDSQQRCKHPTSFRVLLRQQTDAWHVETLATAVSLPAIVSLVGVYPSLARQGSVGDTHGLETDRMKKSCIQLSYAKLLRHFPINQDKVSRR